MLIVCPNVTIRRRLGELDPRTGDASLYRTRDLVPPAMMADLARGRVLIKNWADLTRHYVEQETCEAPPHALFPQVLGIVQRYIAEKVDPLPPAERIDAFLSPYYGWITERLLAAIRPDTAAGEAPEIPDLDRDRPCATADISLFTGKRVREAMRSHVNLVIINSMGEAAAAELLDEHPAVGAYIKNDGLNFTVPYLHNGKPSEYLPDYVVRLNDAADHFLIAEMKGADWEGLTEVKAQAAHRWCAAVNATAEFGKWDYKLAFSVRELRGHLNALAASASVTAWARAAGSV